MSRWAIVGGALVAIAALLWWGFSPDPVADLTYSREGTVEKRTPRRSAEATLVAPLAAHDDDGYVGEVSKVTDAEIEETLQLNAAFAKDNVARFCALADSLSSDPVFRPTQGSRDSNRHMEKLFGVQALDTLRAAGVKMPEHLCFAS